MEEIDNSRSEVTEIKRKKREVKMEVRYLEEMLRIFTFMANKCLSNPLISLGL